MSTQAFYLVWNPAGRMPRVTHPTRREAEDEARRLAKANPRQEFYVLYTEAMITAAPPPPPKVMLTKFVFPTPGAQSKEGVRLSTREWTEL